ncbi:MAG: T9SS type A sorting domain-containing protein, partial [Flavobacteriaceae bacterium]|nr:T9SS type A sorting domain-containing protein [Flavobacteriaceae bacterium]
MKHFYITFTTIILAFSMNAQTTGQLMDLSLSFIGYNSDSQAEIALIATPDFTESNGNSADMGCVIRISGSANAAIVPGNSAFVNDGVGFPAVYEYAIPSSEWDIQQITLAGMPAGDQAYQIIRTPGTTNVLFDTTAGAPIILAVFKVYNNVSLAPPTSGSITLLKNSDALVAANGSGYSDFLNINFPGLSGGTIDLYPGNPTPGDDGFTPAFSTIDFATLSAPKSTLVGVEVYPNPTNRSVTINGISTPKNVTVLNITGQQVQYIENADDTIDMSSLQAGVYFMKITTEN